jgi:hypothetical protein
MNKIKKFFRTTIEEIRKVLEVIQDFVLSLLTPKEELKNLSLDDVFGFSSLLKVTTVPSTFVKTFVYDYVEELDEKVNHYAEDNEVEIKSILVNQTNLGVLYAMVIFERGFENG